MCVSGWRDAITNRKSYLLDQKEIRDDEMMVCLKLMRSHY